MNQWSHTTSDDNQRPIVHENANGEIMEMIWCGCGALQALKDGEGRMTTYEYDVQGRLTTETLPDTNPKQYVYEPLSGRLAALIDPKGQKRRQYYNIDNTVAAKWVENVAVGTLPVAPVYYDWDADLRRVTAWGDNIGTTTLTYHPIGSAGAGKLASWDAPGADNTLTYTYDELGRGVQTKLHTTVLSDYTYNNLGQVVTDANALDTFTYTYQPNSRIPTGYSSVNGQHQYRRPRARKGKPLTDDQRHENNQFEKIRSFIEGTNAVLKRFMRCGRAVYYGIEKAHMQFTLGILAYNLRRYAALARTA